MSPIALGLALQLLVLAAGRESSPPQVRVRLLEKQRPRRLHLEAGGPGRLVLENTAGRRWRARSVAVDCSASRGVCLELGGQQFCSARWRVVGPASVVSVASGGIDRAYPGTLEIKQQQRQCLLIDQVAMDDYALAVACAELGRAPQQALAAQAVAARTFALVAQRRHPGNDYDFCDLTHCQNYRGWENCPAKLRQKLSATRGWVVTMAGRPVLTPYFSTCGGYTAPAGYIWQGGPQQRHLAGRPDALGQRANCSDSPHFRWRLQVERERLCRLLRRRWPALGRGVRPEGCRLEVVSRAAGGWVKLVALQGERRLLVSGEQLHLWLARQLGWGAFKSANFEVETQDRFFVFRGRGLGHGVGMCQHGAVELARRGLDWRAILRFYYPGTEVSKLW